MSQGGLLSVVSIPSVPTSFDTDAGVAIPVANLLQILGGEGIDTSAAGNIVTITSELATAAANVGLANLGICAFDSTDFAVVNGFVTIISGAVFTIDGDVGTVNGPAISLLGNTGSANCGASVSFTAASATELDLIVTDSNFNTLIGKSAGNATVSSSGLNNTAFGYGALIHAGAALANTAIGYGNLSTLTTASLNTSIGATALQNLTTGDSNISIGAFSSNNYTSSETSNIIIGNAGTIGESHVIRIGTQGNSGGKQDKCYIAGITGVATANSAIVTLDTTVGQLGTLASLTVPLGGTGVTTLTLHGILMGNGVNAIQATAEPANGQILIGKTGDFPQLAQLQPGTGISITNGAGTITIATVGGGLSWSAIGASQTLVVNNGYICTAGGALALALPALSAVGTVIGITLDGAGSFSILQGAGQQVRLGAVTSTLGAGGSITSIAQGDSILMVCKTANTLWTIYNVLGNFTVV